MKKASDLPAASDALEFFAKLAPDTPETRRTGKQEWARLLLTEEMRKVRKSAGLTQEQVAEKLGVTQGWVSRLEHAGHDHTLESVVAYFDAVGAEIEFKVTLASDEGVDSVPSCEIRAEAVEGGLGLNVPVPQDPADLAQELDAAYEAVPRT